MSDRRYVEKIINPDQRHIYIGSAWPYVNGSLHLGHLAAFLPADVLARYFRLKGDLVLWTSGSDCHGTPITERARLEGVTPFEIARKYHAEAVKVFEKLGFSYSLYWATMEQHHYERVQKSFLKLFEAGHIIEGDFFLARCEKCKDNRADREINGECPECHDKKARGDQCDHCGKTLDPNELINPTCAECKEVVVFTKTRELFFNLPTFEKQLSEWISKQTHWRDNAKLLTQGWLKSGLKPRCITREIDWGIPVPLKGWEHRRIYVWFEAVHGYLTASQELDFLHEKLSPMDYNYSASENFWKADDPKVLAYYVMGKDNIPFHSLLWPAVLMELGLKLPNHIVSCEFLGLEGEKLSTSRNWVIWAPDFLERYDPDLLRYFLIANGPEKHDTDFTWERFVARVNGELNDNLGNLVQRVISFIQNKFDGKIPEVDYFTERDQELNQLVQTTFEKVGTLIEATEFRQAIETVMNLVKETNRYIAEEVPWKIIKTDFVRAGTIIATAFNSISALSVLLEPFIPAKALELTRILGVRSDSLPGFSRWKVPDIVFKDRILGINEPVKPLFQHLLPSVITEEQARLKAQSSKK